MRALLRGVRPRQWVKNVLVLAAPGAAGVLFEPSGAVRAAFAFLAMTAAASSTYLLNDVRDRHADAAHPTKRHRPVAAGDLPVPLAIVAAGVLGAIAIGAPLVADRPGLGVVVVIYMAVTTAYSFGLKHVRLLELLVVAAGYVLRALAGAVAVDVPVSEWFLIVVSAAAVHLVATKRFAERRAQGEGATRDVLASYPTDVLLEVRHSSVAVTLVGYLLWAFEMHDGGVPWHPLSAVPFTLAMFEYVAATHDGRGESPEDVLLAGGPILVYGAVWAVLFTLGTYLGAS